MDYFYKYFITCLLLVIFQLTLTTSFATYDIFPGFQGSNNSIANITSTANIHSTGLTIAEEVNMLEDIESTTMHSVEITPIIPTPDPSFSCPEGEKPTNIGFYEVPTQKDFVLLIRKTLTKVFDAYHKRALFFLKDIQQATAATAQIEKDCPLELRAAYRQCVKKISNQCEMLTKAVVRSLEAQRHDVAAFTNGTICNLAAMKADPVQLIKLLAKEQVSLDFALPGFLRLLHSCSVHCARPIKFRQEDLTSKYMSDQDLVVRHFLNTKKYVPLHPDNQMRKGKSRKG